MASTNDITGDTIRSRTANQQYRDNWDRIFGNKAADAKPNKESKDASDRSKG